MIEPLALTHQKILQEKLKRISGFFSEYSFANLYLFRKPHQYKVLTDDRGVFVTGKSYDGCGFIMPTVDLSSIGLDILKEISAEYDFIFPVPEEHLPVFAGLNTEIHFVDGESEYIYTVEKISTYKGQKLHSKKNLLNQFLSRYKPAAFPLLPEHVADALRVLQAWQDDAVGKEGEMDYEPCREALELYEKLGLCGGIYYVEKEPAGFVIGEESSGDMFTLHFAKGRRKFKGIYQYMFNQFANGLLPKYTFLNLEQDLGIETLRHAKASYYPDGIVKKYRVKIK